MEACKIWNLIVMLHMVFGEMLKRGIGGDNEVFAFLVYGVVSRGGVWEGSKIVQEIRDHCRHLIWMKKK